MVDIGNLGGQQIFARHINNAGEIVGVGQTAQGNFEAFIATNGQLITLGGLGGTDYPRTKGMNNLGEVVGVSTLIDGNGEEIYRAFLWSNGLTQDLGTLGGDYSEATGINDAGQIVGEAEDSDGNYRAFLYSSGSMLDLGTLGGSESFAYAINNPGHVVGYAETAEGEYRSFKFVDGVMVELDLPQNAYVQQINDAGQMAGGRWNPETSEFHAFLYDGKSLEDLAPIFQSLGISASGVYDMNSQGHVVGWGQGGQGFGSFNIPFLYKNGTVHDVKELIEDDFGWTISAVHGINDSGQMAATAYDFASAKFRCVLLSPVGDDPAGEIDNLILRIEELIANGHVADRDVKPSLKMLQDAIQAINVGDHAEAISKLTAVINHTKALLRSRRISAAVANELIDSAQSIIDMLK